MKKLISTLIVGVFTASAFAATPAPTTADNKPAVAEAKTTGHAKKEKAAHVAKKHKEAAPAASAAPAVK